MSIKGLLLFCFNSWLLCTSKHHSTLWEWGPVRQSKVVQGTTKRLRPGLVNLRRSERAWVTPWDRLSHHLTLTTHMISRSMLALIIDTDETDVFVMSKRAFRSPTSPRSARVIEIEFSFSDSALTQTTQELRRRRKVLCRNIVLNSMFATFILKKQWT